jgi:hypothetical protein
MMMMLRPLIRVSMMLALPVSAQQSLPLTTKQDVRISKDKPTVYITFERVGHASPLRIRKRARYLAAFAQ